MCVWRSISYLADKSLIHCVWCVYMYTFSMGWWESSNRSGESCTISQKLFRCDSVSPVHVDRIRGAHLEPSRLSSPYRPSLRGFYLDHLIQMRLHRDNVLTSKWLQRLFDHRPVAQTGGPAGGVQVGQKTKPERCTLAWIETTWSCQNTQRTFFIK